jgi:hypothetical protein
VLPLPRILVLVEVAAVEVGQAGRILGKWAGTQSRMTPMPQRWRWSTIQRKSSGLPKRLVGAK